MKESLFSTFFIQKIIINIINDRFDFWHDKADDDIFVI